MLLRACRTDAGNRGAGDSGFPGSCWRVGISAVPQEEAGRQSWEVRVVGGWWGVKPGSAGNGALREHNHLHLKKNSLPVTELPSALLLAFRLGNFSTTVSLGLSQAWPFPFLAFGSEYWSLVRQGGCCLSLTSSHTLDAGVDFPGQRQGPGGRSPGPAPLAPQGATVLEPPAQGHSQHPPNLRGAQNSWWRARPGGAGCGAAGRRVPGRPGAAATQRGRSRRQSRVFT